MDTFFEKLENRLMPMASFFQNQRHLLSIRDGMVTAVPLTIIGSIFLLVASPPVSPDNLSPSGIGLIDGFLQGWYNFAQANHPILIAPFRATMGILALMVCFVIAYSLARSYGKNALNYAVYTTAIFILVISPIADGMMAVKYFDSKGIIMAILVGLSSVEIMRFVENRGWTVKMPKGVPHVVEKSFTTLFPFAISLLVIYGVSIVVRLTTGLSLPDAIYGVFAMLTTAVENVFVIAPLTAFENLLFGFGVHPTAVVGPILDPLELINQGNNADFYQLTHSFQNLPHIYTKSFWAFYVALGGGGATLALNLLLLRSKNQASKEIGKLALIPSIFNINEPLIFGLPIFLNPILIIPFMIAPTVNLFLGWFATQLGLVNAAVFSAPWTTPAPLGALISSLDFKAFLLVFVMLAVNVFIYMPFLKMHERTQAKLQAEETVIESEI